MFNYFFHFFHPLNAYINYISNTLNNQELFILKVCTKKVTSTYDFLINHIDLLLFKLIKFLKKFYDEYNIKSSPKGLYLHGSFGSGKTYLISALFNELAKQNVSSVIVYFPEFLRTLKSSFNDIENSYNERFNYVKNAKLLLIDDIGAENLTTWGRDEILGTILQYRMQENLPTFFTSNLNMKELEEHLSITTSSSDKVKARRIIERIKYLSTEMKMIGVNRR